MYVGARARWDGESPLLLLLRLRGRLELEHGERPLRAIGQLDLLDGVERGGAVRHRVALGERLLGAQQEDGRAARAGDLGELAVPAEHGPADLVLAAGDR